MLLEINNINKTFFTNNSEINVLNNILFNIKNNEFISIIGPSGSGKSTLLDIIAELDKDYKGKIIKHKKNIIIGYMFQNDALFNWLTVYQNAILGLKILKKDTEENLSYVKYLLKKYGLIEFIDKKPYELSGGMKQRVALIRTLAIKPDILLLDEPFSALDYQTRLKVSNDVYNILKSENKAVIMVTHDIAEAISMSDKVLVFSKRPATIKNSININLNKNNDLINIRNTKEFMSYYDMLWKEIDVYE